MSFEFKVVDAKKASDLRKRFINTFVNTNHKLYQAHIKTLHTYPDGEFYIGYLWDFLLDNQDYEYECNMESACEYLKQKQNIYVMWDMFSNHRVCTNAKFAVEYAKDTIIQASATSIAQMLPNEWEAWNNKSQIWFPEDIYCFDDTMSWYVIFTHEGWDSYSKPELNEDEYIRICFLKRSKDK